MAEAILINIDAVCCTVSLGHSHSFPTLSAANKVGYTRPWGSISSNHLKSCYGPGFANFNPDLCLMKLEAQQYPSHRISFPNGAT